MRILEDANEYVSTMEWAEKVIEELGIDGAEKLKKAIEGWLEAPAAAQQKAGLNIEKLKSESFCLFRVIQDWRLKTFMAPGIEAVKRVKKHGQEQQQKRAQRQTWNGRTREQIEKRNQTIIEHFKKTHLTKTGFADKHAAKYGLKSRQVRAILSQAVGN